MKIAEIKDLSGIAQSIAITISIIVAGCWALYQFPILNNDLVNRKPLMTAKMSISQKIIDDKLFLKVDAEIFNKGNDLMWLEFPTPPLTISRVKYIDGKPYFSLVNMYQFKAYYDVKPDGRSATSKYALSPGIYNSSELIISQNSNFKFPFLLPIETEGVYYVAFHAIQRHSSHKDILREKKYPKNTVLSLHVSDYVILSNKPNNQTKSTTSSSVDKK